MKATEWPPFAMAIKELVQVLPRPGAILDVKTLPGSSWVARTLSLLIIREARYVIIQLDNRRATKFPGVLVLVCASTQLKFLL
jgi:hypothetical protein